MTNRAITSIVKDQKPIVLTGDDTVRDACKAMADSGAGSVLVSDGAQHLVGIFTGRDAVKALAKGEAPGATKLKSVMTKEPVTVTASSRAVDALKAMAEGEFRHVPVIERGCICGIVSRGDLKGMEIEEYKYLVGKRAGEERSVGDIVKGQRPLTLRQDETVQAAAQAMRKRKAGSVLVVDAKDKLVGIFTGRDAVKVLAKSKTPATVTLSKAMTKKPATIGPEAHAIEALRTMCLGCYRHLPVVDGAKIVGVVSRNDFTGIEIDRLDEEAHLCECLW